jgi:23S rRNA (uracil1939-C5)-methyltransferase
VTPFCTHYQTCGGCQLQHLSNDQQLAEKQLAVDMLFKKFAGVTQLPWQAPLNSQAKHYRRSGRIAVIYDVKTKQFLVGYRQKQSKKIINIDHCDILLSQWQPIFNQFRQALPKLKAGKGISHLQLCSVDSGDYLIIRHTQVLPKNDIRLLEAMCDEHSWQLVLSGEAGQYSEIPQPNYQLAEYNLTMHFGFDNFIQINSKMNDRMINQAVSWLNLTKQDQVLDLFCGVGNFTLPLALNSAYVVGVEGVASSIDMAKRNAQINGLTNTAFYCQDLTENIQQQDWFNREYSVLLLDPSRMGALDILAQLKLTRFTRILYVACDPVTMARDSKVLIESGFVVKKISLMNMFPNTSHIETMVLFEKES